MLLIKVDLSKPISLNLPGTAKLLSGGYFFADANLNYFTPTQIADYKITEISDIQVINDLNKLDYSIQDDGSVRKMTTGPSPLSDQLEGTELESFMRGAKYISKKNASISYDSRFSSLKQQESALEQSTWDQQLTEATAYLNDNSAEVPLLELIASSRGITVNEVALRIQAAATNYANARNSLLAELKSHFSSIDNSTSALDLKSLGWI